MYPSLASNAGSYAGLELCRGRRVIDPEPATSLDQSLALTCNKIINSHPLKYSPIPMMKLPHDQFILIEVHQVILEVIHPCETVLGRGV